jgi:hypothetical protein
MAAGVSLNGKSVELDSLSRISAGLFSGSEHTGDAEMLLQTNSNALRTFVT